MPGIVVVTLLSYGTFVKSPAENLKLPNFGDFHMLYKKINTFQKPVLIAGPGGVTNQIPTFCKQSILFSDEAAHAIYFEHYFNHVDSITTDFIQAYAADTLPPVLDFVSKYELDYLIIDSGFFELNRMWTYEPHYSRLNEMVKGRKKGRLCPDEPPGCGNRKSRLAIFSGRLQKITGVECTTD